MALPIWQLCIFYLSGEIEEAWPIRSMRDLLRSIS